MIWPWLRTWPTSIVVMRNGEVVETGATQDLSVAQYEASLYKDAV